MKYVIFHYAFKMIIFKEAFFVTVLKKTKYNILAFYRMSRKDFYIFLEVTPINKSLFFFSSLLLLTSMFKLDLKKLSSKD